jgi:hypothetical protein
MLNSAIPFSSIGPLFGKSFDRAVALVVRRWRFLLIAFGVAYSLSVWLTPISLFLTVGLAVYWIMSALADAVREDRPDYRMNLRSALNYFGAQF